MPLTTPAGDPPCCRLGAVGPSACPAGWRTGSVLTMQLSSVDPFRGGGHRLPPLRGISASYAEMATVFAMRARCSETATPSRPERHNRAHGPLTSCADAGQVSVEPQ